MKGSDTGVIVVVKRKVANDIESNIKNFSAAYFFGKGWDNGLGAAISKEDIDPMPGPGVPEM